MEVKKEWSETFHEKDQIKKQLTDVVFSLWFDRNILLYTIALLYQESAHVFTCETNLYLPFKSCAFHTKLSKQPLQ